jgi:hypothetical protein
VLLVGHVLSHTRTLLVVVAAGDALGLQRSEHADDPMI